MNVAKKVFRGSIVILVAEVTTQACNMIRNIILARTLTKADFGVAAMLGMTISLFEIGGRLSIENCLVQSRDGDRPGFMAAAHFIQALLGLISGALIFLSAHPMAVFFNIPEATWALRILALVPVLRSLSHLDVYRMNRELRFGPGVLIDLVPQVVITLAAWPLTQIWKSYVVLVWLLLGKQVSYMIASHFVAANRYRWSFDRITVRSILMFGWPMLIGSLLMFGIMQGDRFAIGIRFSVSELGVYTIAGSLALLPASTLFRLSGSILLPLLSSARDDRILFNKRLSIASEIMALFSGAYALVMILAGSSLVALIFGAKYGDSGALTAWLGLAQAFRLLQGVPTVASMANEDTKNLMYTNLFRLTGLGLAFPLAFAGASLATIAACAAIGESVALIGSFRRFSKMHHVSPKVYVPSFLLAIGFIVLSGALAAAGMAKLPTWIVLGGTTILVICFAAVHLTFFGETRRLLLSKLSSHDLFSILKAKFANQQN